MKAALKESLANALRRSVFKIPIVAIDEIEISKNDSPLYDETVAHRLGLVPLKHKTFNAKKPFELKLDAKGEGFVYSGNLKGDIAVVHDRIPITYLKQGETISVKATTKEGVGSEHSKFVPGLMYYRNLAEISKSGELPEELVRVCPKKVFEMKNGGVVIGDSSKCDMCGLCLEYLRDNKKDVLKISPSNEVLITIESFGQTGAKDIFNKAIEALKKELEDFSKKLK